MERKGNVTLETQETRPSAPTRIAHCVALFRPRSTLSFSRQRQVGEGSGGGFTLHRLRQSPSLLVIVERTFDVEVLTFRSNDYSKNIGINSEWKALLLNKVVVGNGKKLTQGDKSLTEPPTGYDSVSTLGRFFCGCADQELGCRESGPRWSSELRRTCRLQK